MTTSPTSISKALKSRFKEVAIDCPIHYTEIDNLGTYLSNLDSLNRSTDQQFWYRGHSKLSYELKPSALRYLTIEKRESAVASVNEFKRIYTYKIAKPPADDDQLRWTQLAQHYGLPTKLLDWTLNPLIALYFACVSNDDEDGIVCFFNPEDLNRNSAKKEAVLSPNEDLTLINKYLNSKCVARSNGKNVLAISPTWNSERIIQQQGAFTIHGSKFELDNKQAPSLIGLPIMREFKSKLRQELEKVGVSEMHVFPEPEHACNYLKGKI